jgi:hypothetical protein
MERIFHISEEPSIGLFRPRPSPSKFAGLEEDVVFGIGEMLLHNYLLPRECPRVTYYATAATTPQDRDIFLQTGAEYVLIVESKWVPVIQRTELFCYEFDSTNFSIIDECARYYISKKEELPVSVTRIEDVFGELFKRKNVEVRIVADLMPIAEKVAGSSLNFSLIRMRNAFSGYESPGYERSTW